MFSTIHKKVIKPETYFYTSEVNLAWQVDETGLNPIKLETILFSGWMFNEKIKYVGKTHSFLSLQKFFYSIGSWIRKKITKSHISQDKELRNYISKWLLPVKVQIVIY